MNGIVIKIGGGDHGDAMKNSVCICDCILKGKKDGDEVTAEIKGTLMEHDGKRYIAISTVDGEDVQEEEMDYRKEGMMGMDANESLDNYMKGK